MIHYNIYGETKRLDFLYRGVIRKVLNAVAKRLGDKEEHVVSFILVNDEEIHKINRDYRKIDRSTDVISFANIDGNPNRELSYELGDIYISYEHLFKQAKEYGHSVLREFAFLVTHGMLHLYGYDHMTKEDEIVMFKIQDEVLDICKIYR